jgi:hypothetical protein
MTAYGEPVHAFRARRKLKPMKATDHALQHDNFIRYEQLCGAHKRPFTRP